MALEGLLLGVAADADSMLITAMTSGVTGALNYVRTPLRVLMGLYVLLYGFSMVAGEGSGRMFFFAVARAVCIVIILQAAYYIPWVQEFFFTTLPNEIAAALNGPRITINSAQQFDKLNSASLHSAGLILKKASGFFDGFDRLIVWGLFLVGFVAVLGMFVIFYMSKVMIAVVLIMGPFLIPMYLFGGTRGITSSWIGKIVGVITWQLAASVVIRIVFVIIDGRVRVLEANPGASTDEMIATYLGIVGMFWVGLVLMAVIPTAAAVGGGVGAAHVAGAVGVASAVGRASSMAGAASRHAPLRLRRT